MFSSKYKKLLQDEEMFLSIMKSFKMKIQELLWKNPQNGMQIKDPTTQFFRMFFQDLPPSLTAGSPENVVHLGKRRMGVAPEKPLNLENHHGVWMGRLDTFVWVGILPETNSKQVCT